MPHLGCHHFTVLRTVLCQVTSFAGRDDLHQTGRLQRQSRSRIADGRGRPLLRDIADLDHIFSAMSCLIGKMNQNDVMPVLLVACSSIAKTD